MNSDTSVVEYVRDVIRDRLERFARLARLPIDETATAEVDAPELATAAQSALAALELSNDCYPHDSYLTLRNHLRQAAIIASGMIEMRFLSGLLRNETVSQLAGYKLVGERANLRLSRNTRRLRKLQRRMFRERFVEHAQQLVEELVWKAEGPEPELVEFAKQSTFNAQRQICHAADLNEPDVTTVHELWSRFQQLSYTLEIFRQVLRHDEDDFVSQEVNELQLRIAPIVDYSSAKMRCTNWLEQSRDADEITALRSLIALAAEQIEHYYGLLASGWNAQRALDLGTKFERLLSIPSNP